MQVATTAAGGRMYYAAALRGDGKPVRAAAGADGGRKGSPQPSNPVGNRLGEGRCWTAWRNIGQFRRCLVRQLGGAIQAKIAFYNVAKG